MLALERRNLIVEKLQEEKKVVVSELSREFGVSEETIRRDLERLDKDGIARKSYGGAVFNENSSIDMPFNVRQKRNVNGKQKIAELVAGLIDNGDHIILDASTTAVFIAKAIKQKQNITVVTNSIEILIELSDVSDWNIISSGGSLKEGYLALVGPKAVDGLSQFYAEKAFFSCKGIDTEKGITEGNEQFAQTKAVMMHSAAKRYLTVDSSKFGVIGFSKVCNIEDMDVIITDEEPDSTWKDFCERNHIELIYPAAE